MVRIEHMDFLLPMKIGELAELTAEIVYTSTHSLLVEIKVHAENIITGNVIIITGNVIIITGIVIIITGNVIIITGIVIITGNVVITGNVSDDPVKTCGVKS